MKKPRNARLLWLFMVVGIFVFATSTAVADYMKMDPPPDVDKSAHGHNGKPTCWLAAAANMLAGAGYGDGTTVQARADDIYKELVTHYGTGSGGWTDTAISWWLGSANNTWAGNPYDVVTVYGNKTKTPWANSNGARFIGNELRRCQMAGLSISWPRTSANGSPYGGHAIACWGDSGGSGTLTGNPARVKVTDSDRDTGGDVQTYTYDSYTNPNPSGYNEGNGWYVNYSNNHPFIKHIVTLCPTDDPGDHTQTQKVVGSYRIHQDNRLLKATDLHYKVGTDTTILSYKTTINWSTASKPVIKEDPAAMWEQLTVDWDLSRNPVPYCTWVTITTEFVLPVWNSIQYSDVYFTYPDIGIYFPSFRWRLYTRDVEEPDIPNATGGYVVGAFDLMRDMATGLEVIGEYRLLHEYDFNQDPEMHEFILEPPEQMTSEPFLVGNLRFGHSYGRPDNESLWQFDEWMTRDSEIYMLGAAGEAVFVQLDWQGRLPYPQGENYLGEYEPPECTEYLTQDFNRDCIVDFLDFAIFSRVWLNSTLP